MRAGVGREEERREGREDEEEEEKEGQRRGERKKGERRQRKGKREKRGRDGGRREGGRDCDVLYAQEGRREEGKADRNNEEKGKTTASPPRTLLQGPLYVLFTGFSSFWGTAS